MTKVIPIVALFAIAIVTTLLLNGCGGNQVAKLDLNSDKNHLNTFLSLHNQFCEKKYPSPDSLKSILAESSTLKPAEDYDGVYEVLVEDVSYAISPEDDGCTTDVMIQRENTQLFSFEDINKALLEHGYIETSDPVSRKDRGTDQTELTVIEKKYISPSGEVTTLDFPLEKKDKYYMTLFAEKFSEAVKKKKERALKSLKMASLTKF